MNQFTFGVFSPGERFFSKIVAGTKFFDFSEESTTGEGSSSSSANLRSSRLSPSHNGHLIKCIQEDLLIFLSEY